MFGERKPGEGEQRLVGLPHHRRERRGDRITRKHHREQARRDGGMTADPELTRIRAAADERARRANSLQGSRRAIRDEIRRRRSRRDGRRKGGDPPSPQHIECLCVPRFCDRVDERDALTLQVEQTPAIGFIGAARQIAGDDDRVRYGLVRRFENGLDRDHRRSGHRLLRAARRRCPGAIAAEERQEQKQSRDRWEGERCTATGSAARG